MIDHSSVIAILVRPDIEKSDLGLYIAQRTGEDHPYDFIKAEYKARSCVEMAGVIDSLMDQLVQAKALLSHPVYRSGGVS